MESDGKNKNRTQRPIVEGGNGHFPERLKEALGGLSIRAFAQRVGMSGTAISKYLSGESEPTRPTLIAISEAAGVSVQWLATGEGSKESIRNRDPFEIKLFKLSEGEDVNLENLYLLTIQEVLTYINDCYDYVCPEIISEVCLNVLKRAVETKNLHYQDIKIITTNYVGNYFVPMLDSEIEELTSKIFSLRRQSKIGDKNNWYSEFVEEFGDPHVPHLKEERAQMISWLAAEIKVIEAQKESLFDWHETKRDWKRG